MRTISYPAAAAVTIAALLAAVLWGGMTSTAATGQVKVMVNAGIRALLTITS